MFRHTGESVSDDTGPLPEGVLPPTVQAVIASRIDHLPQRAKDVVRKASVFSRATFDVSELALIAEVDQEVLDRLEFEELLIRDEERSSVWRFRHGIVKDVAYESLPKRERERLHLRVADELASDPETAGRYPRSIAYHLERAARAALDLEPGNRVIAERAAEALAHAGDVALASSDIGASEELFGRALDLAGPQRSWGLREAHVLASQGEARYWQGEFERAVPVLEHALELGDGDAGVRAQASRFLGDIELSIRGRAPGRGPRGGARARRRVVAGTDVAGRGVGAVLAWRSRHGARDVPGGPRDRPAEPGGRRVGRGAGARDAGDARRRARG
jgi:hypothetical protein